MVDVVIIGAGVTGCLTARALSRYKLSVLIVDKASDISEGSTKANSGIIHAGYDARPHSVRASLNIKGTHMMPKLVKELSVSYSNTGSLVAAFTGEELLTLQKLFERGLQNGVPNLELVTDKERLFSLEKRLNPEVIAGLYAPTAGIISPYELAQAACENAIENGVQLLLNTRVTGIEKHGSFFMVKAQGEKTSSYGTFTLNARYIVNAAGLYADDISAMIEEKWFSILPRRGEYLLLDKRSAPMVTKTLFGTPSSLGKGILVTPTVDGNVLLGPTSIEQQHKASEDTTAEGLELVFTKARRYIPELDERDIIHSFAGVRATPDTGDFIVQASQQVHGLIHAAGIDSPGLSASPAIAERVLEILSDQGLPLVSKEDFQPLRKPFIHFKDLSYEDKNAKIEANPLYGHVICRCETVTEAEILEAIRRKPGATTLDGVKRRVRAGMGRCQGGFCAPLILDLMARELRIPNEQVTKKGGKSLILIKKLKETEQ